MNGIKKIFVRVGEDLDDYASRPVPKENCIGRVTQGLVWASAAFCLPAFTVGGALAAAMDGFSFPAAVFLGAVVSALIGFLTGAIGAGTHLTSGFNARFTLGMAGGRIFSLILAVSLFGWFGYQCHDFAKSVVSILTMFGFPNRSPVVWAIVSGLLTIVTVIAGFNGILLLSVLGTPPLITLSLVAAFVTACQVDGSALQAAFASAAGSMSLSAGNTLVVGSYITGSCITADVSRFSKTQKEAFRGSFLGRMAAFPLALLPGGFFQYAYGISDLCDVMFTYCGMAMFVLFVPLISSWGINNYNLYWAVLGIINTLDGHIRLPQRLITLLAGAVSTLLGALGIMDASSSFLNFLGVLIPPAAAVMIADCYLYERNSVLYDYRSAGEPKNFQVNTCVSAAVGIVAGLLCNYGNIRFLNALCLIVPACIVAMLSGVAVLVIYNTVTHSRIRNS